MLENIENLLQIVKSQNADQLRMKIGSTAKLYVGENAYDITPNPLTQQAIIGCINPIVPESVRRQISSMPVVEFDHILYGAGTFHVLISRAGGLEVIITAKGEVESAPPPAVESTADAYSYLDASFGADAAPPSFPAPPAPGAPPQQAAFVAEPPAPAPRPSQPAQPVQPVQPVSYDASPAATPRGNGNTIDRLFFEMVAAKASDLHLAVTCPPLIRRDGSMAPLNSDSPLSASAMERLLTEMMPAKNREEYSRRNDTDFAYEIDGLARFRANIFRDRKGMGAVFRVIPSKILTAEDLGLSPAILKLCALSKGLVLVTGPTGSGKSTTLCALIDHINRTRSDHIITIEDPIEFVHDNKKCLINQREVHSHTDSFKDALRAALREDPDIVLVGEMRDLETIAIAIETAETGHLVFGTLHTSTAASTVDRIIDQFPADRQSQIRVMLSESLRGVVAQTLCKRTGGGRVAALEVLVVNSAISNLIREGKTFQIPSIMQTGKALGMVALNDALLDLVKKGLVEPDEAYVKAVDKTGFETLLKRANIDLKVAHQPGVA